MRKLTSLLTMLLLGISFVYAQQINIKGTVTDQRLNEPIIGASVLVEGSSNGTITDMNGDFSLKNVSKGNVLIVSYIGYQPQRLTINGNQTSFNIMLTEDTQTLDEVVVVGFGTQKKVNLTGAVATVDTKTLESRPVSSVSQALQGVMPGLNIDINDKGGRLDYNPNINIRGAGNLGTGSSASPLVLIDGAEGDINSLNPQDIANISVLKDAAASSIYGSRAPFGVILITTKSGEAGKATIQYSDNFRWSHPTNIPDMLDSYRFAKYFNAAQKTMAVPLPFYSQKILLTVLNDIWLENIHTPLIQTVPKPVISSLLIWPLMIIRIGHGTSSTKQLSDKNII